MQPTSEQADHGDVALYLLAGAVHASHAIDQLIQLAVDHPTGDPAALADIDEAITTMTHVRTRLLRDADKVTQHHQTPSRLR